MAVNKAGETIITNPVSSKITGQEDGIASEIEIPTIETPPADTADGVISSVEDANKAVIDNQTEAIENTKATTEGLEKIAEDDLDEAEETKDTNIKAEKTYYNKNKKLIKDKETKTAIIQKKIGAKAKKESEDAVKILESEKADAKTLATQALALQKKTDEDAVYEAKTQIEIDRQLSAMAFHKLGLGFSSGIILNSQNIATAGAYKIATLKVQASYNQTEMINEANSIQNKYSSDINSTISKYTDIQLANEQAIINRIDATNSNLLLNSKQKKDAIEALEEEYQTTTDDISAKLISEQERLSDKLGTQTEKLQLTLTTKQNNAKLKLGDEVLNGSVANMTPQEIALKEKELGLAPGTIMQKSNTQVSTAIRGMVDNFIGTDEIINTMGLLTDKVNAEMKQGRTMAEAVELVGTNYIKNNERYITQQKALSNKTSGTGTGTSSAVQDKYQALFNKSVPSKMSETAMLDAISKREAEDGIKAKNVAEDAVKEKIASGGLSSENFNKIYGDDITLIDKAIKDGKENVMKKSITNIISDLKGNGTNDEQVVNYLLQSGLVNTTNNKDGLYFDTKDGKQVIKETSGLNDTIYNF